MNQIIFTFDGWKKINEIKYPLFSNPTCTIIKDIVPQPGDKIELDFCNNGFSKDLKNRGLKINEQRIIKQINK